jgi:hypothetical protein
MKINEVTSSLKTYIASVRVVLKHGSVTARTSIEADSSAHAFAMLSRMYGQGNVLTISEVMRESLRTEQDQLQDDLLSSTSTTHNYQQKIDSEQALQVLETWPRSRQRRRISNRPVPAQIKHELVQDRLTQQFMRQSNIVKPTADDVRIARGRAETRLKRADLKYQRRLDAAG